MFRIMIKFEIEKNKDNQKLDSLKQKKYNKNKMKKVPIKIKRKKLKSKILKCKKKIKKLSDKAKAHILKIQEMDDYIEEDKIRTEYQHETPKVEELKEGSIPLDPLIISKYKNQLVKPFVYKPYVIKYNKKKGGKCYKGIKHYYRIDMTETYQQILPPGFPKTKVYGYGGLVVDPRTGRTKYSISAPGATFEARRGVPVEVKWVNKLKGEHMFPIDPTLHWANPNDMPMHPHKPWPLFPPGFKEAQQPIPTVVHLHGGEVHSDSDGHPDAWFTHNKKHGSAFAPYNYMYPNKQEATTLWYHDHALGLTRLNVYAGLAGFYILRDWKKSRHYCDTIEGKLNLPYGKYEIPLVIQDKLFNTDGSLRFNNVGLNPDIHPYWVPGLNGNTIVVNGKVWPNLHADRGMYRFRLLNGSNSRFYNLQFTNGMEFIQIGSDGGYLKHPAKLTSLLLAPAERADILVDFSRILPGTMIRLLNNASNPYPFGAPPNPDTVGQIMQFTITNRRPWRKPTILPKTLNHIEELIPNEPERIVTLNDIIGAGGPQAMFLNGQMWSATPTENLKVGSTQDWCIVGMTAGAHPIHIHLIQFQLINRQNYNVEAYVSKWEEENGPMPLHHTPKIIPFKPYLIGDSIPPNKNELGWKDTIVTNPGQVTRIRVRIAPQGMPEWKVKPGENYFSFNPSDGPGYVWHCHLLDHEDNEMMRPMMIEL